MAGMQKITNIFEHQKLTFSFELFPPKTDEGYSKLLNSLPMLCALKPDFISCTYGAGGGSREKTLSLVEHIQNQHQTTSVAHLTCVLHTKNEIKDILTDMNKRGIYNVLALRGDAPRDNPNWTPGINNFKYSWELVAFIRELFKDQFSIGVAGFPEGHILCPDREQDTRYLKNKIVKGADYVITQLFFKDQDYFDYVVRLKKLGVNSRIIPGILPITDYPALVRFTAMCGASIPQEVHDIFRPIAEDREKTLAAGIDFCLKQCRELLKGGAPGLHFYTLNKIHPVDVIIQELKGHNT
jgi:methylenetetrahydrofolate reductase (NADPH)